MSTTYVTCPKCFGAKRFSVWSHIVNGDCFCCAGNGTVPADRISRGESGPVGTPKPSRTVTLPSFGVVTIQRDGAGLVAWFPDTDPDRPGSGAMARFDVVAGRVTGLEVSNGIRRALHPAVERELQAAVRPS